MNILDVKFAVVDVPLAIFRVVYEVALVRGDRTIIRNLNVVYPVGDLNWVRLLILFLLAADGEKPIGQDFLYLTQKRIVLTCLCFVAE